MHVKADALSSMLKNEFREGTFIPEYQREYVWKEQNCIKLFEDIIEYKGTYMGPMVIADLRASETNRVEIVDGQQRMTTLTILLSCCRAICYHAMDKSDGPVKVLYQLIQENITAHIGASETLFIDHELEKEKQGYKTACTLKADENHSIKANDHRMVKCWHAARKFVAEYIFDIDPGPNDDGFAKWMDEGKFDDPTELGKEACMTKLQNLVGWVLDSTVTPIEVKGEESVFLVFERINSRGVRLSAIDLIKNAILQHSKKLRGNRQEFGAITENWSLLCTEIGDEMKVISPEQAFLNCLAVENKDFQLLSTKALYKKAKSYIQTLDGDEACSEFIARLAKTAKRQRELFTQPFDPSLGSNFIEQPFTLLRECGYGSPLAPILLADKKGDEFGKAAASFAFRILIRQQGIRGNQRIAKNLQEHLYAALKENFSCPLEFYGHLCQTALEKKLDNEDNVVKELLKEAAFSQHSVPKVILLLCSNDMLPGGVTLDFKQLQLEHILPQKPEKWADFKVADSDESKVGNILILDGDDYSVSPEFAHALSSHQKSIGNLALLYSEYNAEISNKPFADRRHTYKAHHPDTNPKGTIFPDVLWIDEIASDFNCNWTKEAIQVRAGKIAEKFIQLVPAFGFRTPSS